MGNGLKSRKSAYPVFLLGRMGWRCRVTKAV
jgi:hypothetical protein